MEDKQNKLLPLMIGSIGVVYGDIGTSPLYALESCFKLAELPIIPENIIGIISVFIWLLIAIVFFKYINLIMKCDQQGEGGILVLSSLAKQIDNTKIKKFASILGIIGVALFFGDSIITPAISVLSAVEGMQLIANIPTHFIMLIAIIILTILFSMQKQGSGKIGNYFGYVMMIWFIVLSFFGINSILNNPNILLSLNPYHALNFILAHKALGFIIIGSAILVISGVEALYADMGHFGKKAISLSWIFFVFPSLTLSYLGQGALLLNDPSTINNVFYLMTPKFMMKFMVILSIIATIIASQAVISGIFSLSKQAIMLNYIPRMKVLYTSTEQMGQIYVPAMNYLLFALTVSAVIIFRNSTNLSFAYGLSVAGVMLISSILTFILACFKWKWSIFKIILIFIPLLLLDFIFVSSNLLKIVDGAWYTLVIAFSVMYVVHVWLKGNKILNNQKKIENISLTTYLKKHFSLYNTRIPGCAVFLTRDINSVPKTLQIHLQHNKYLHEKLFFISITTEDVVKVKSDRKFEIETQLENIYTIKARYGFSQTPDLNKIISWVKSKGILESNEKISFFLSRGIAVVDDNHHLGRIAERIYLFLSKNTLPVYDFLKIDFKNVLELGVIYRI